MNILTRTLYPSVACAVLLTACGGSDSTPSGADTNSDPNPDVPFFNDVAKTQYVDSMIGRFVSMFRPLSTLSDGVLAKRTIAMTENESVSCSGGGEIAVSLESDPVTEEPTAASITFNNCIESGETSNGGISFSANLDETGDNGTITLTADNLTVTGGDENLALDGAVTVQMQTNGAVSTFSIGGRSLALTAGGDSITFSNYSLTAIDNEATDEGSLSASMTVASSVDGTITFNVDPPLAADGTSDYPTSGTVTMTHSDGSSLTIHADNGDPATFDYTINDNGSITTGVQRWDETDIGDL